MVLFEVYILKRECTCLLLSLFSLAVFLHLLLSTFHRFSIIYSHANLTLSRVKRHTWPLNDEAVQGNGLSSTREPPQAIPDAWASTTTACQVAWRSTQRLPSLAKRDEGWLRYCWNRYPVFMNVVICNSSSSALRGAYFKPPLSD